MSKYPDTSFYKEELCNRCGICCHKQGVPCEHLQFATDGKSECADYPNRLGWHWTIEGKELLCVPIQHEIEKGRAPKECAYLKLIEAKAASDE